MRAPVHHLLTAALLALLLSRPAFAQEEEIRDLPVKPSAEIEAGLYGETGRLTIRLTFKTESFLPENYRVVLHLADPDSGVSIVEADHVPPTATELWSPEEPVRYTVAVVVPERSGRRPAVLVLVGLANPTLKNGFKGRFELLGDQPFGDRRFLVGRVDAAKGEANAAQLRAAAAERANRGHLAEAFHLLEQAMIRGATLEEKLAVTADLLALDPPPGEPVTGPEEVRTRRLVAAEKLRWLRDKASSLLGRKELKLALRVMERVGGVAEEERNTKVVGEPNAAQRAKKDIVDVKSRILRELSDDEKKAVQKLLDKCADVPKKLLAAAESEAKKGRLKIARRLLVEVLYHREADRELKDKTSERMAEIEKRLLYELTPAEEKRLEGLSDHPAFHRTAFVPTGRFVLLGPEGLVKSIARSSSHRLDVASVLLTDLFGRSPVDPGHRVIIYWKETYSGPATGGGGQIIIGDADPNAKGTKIDTGLYYHEFTHCVDDTRPVHSYKRGLTEGIANVGSIYVRDMFAGETGRFEALSRGGRAQLRRHHLDRENAYWLIPAYAPSEGMLTEILARHAPAANDHVDWPKLGQVYRLYRASKVKSPRTHRIMAHMGHAMAQAMGQEVWDTLREFRFPVDEGTFDEIERQRREREAKIRMAAMRRDSWTLARLADEFDPDFVASRARYAALQILDARNATESEEAEKVRRRLGVIRKLHVVGPFYPSLGNGLAEVFPPGEELDFDVEYMTPQGVARWRVPEKGAQHYARMDGRGVVLLKYGYPDRAVTYAVTHVTIPDETDALAWIGADDEVALWVNGVHVQRNHGRRPLIPDWERWPIRLAKGRNRIRLKIANQHGNTGFCIRLTLPDGQPIDGMEADLEPATERPVPEDPKWNVVHRDTFQRRSLGRKYEVAAGSFEVKGKALRGKAGNRRPGWRPFSVRPGFPQDRPAALLWLTPAKETPADFVLRVVPKDGKVPKIVLTWDGEGGELPLSGWSLILVPKKDTAVARLERYDYLHYLKGAKVTLGRKPPVVEVKRLGDRVFLKVGETVVLDGASCPPLRKRRIGLAVWGANPEIDALELAYPKASR